MLHFHSQTFQFSWKQKLRDRMKFLRRPPSGSHSRMMDHLIKELSLPVHWLSQRMTQKSMRLLWKQFSRNAQRKRKVPVSLFKTLSCKLNFESPFQAVVCCCAHMIHATTKCLSVIHSFLTTTHWWKRHFKEGVFGSYRNHHMSVPYWQLFLVWRWPNL